MQTGTDKRMRGEKRCRQILRCATIGVETSVPGSFDPRRHPRLQAIRCNDKAFSSQDPKGAELYVRRCVERTRKAREAIVTQP